MVAGAGSAAFTVTVTLAGGDRIIENVIIDVHDGHVTRHVDVEAWD